MCTVIQPFSYLFRKHNSKNERCHVHVIYMQVHAASSCFNRKRQKSGVSKPIKFSSDGWG